ncbi:hypothetical protein CF319_g6211 [Tilletia indica]|nr:hypothetical protein CF319_g6211 [Tilletia indica]KAE8222103.1 hypothetical protein CF326_g8434 [Tilletia indica]
MLYAWIACAFKPSSLNIVPFGPPFTAFTSVSNGGSLVLLLLGLGFRSSLEKLAKFSGSTSRPTGCYSLGSHAPSSPQASTFKPTLKPQVLSLLLIA